MCNQRLSLTRPKTQCKPKLFYNKRGLRVSFPQVALSVVITLISGGEVS